ncbi:MAG: hypothetical protein AUK47_04000 [Deltaproteobacteria bacterium CG2_30_63_29]|nr:MAG: hypothetical protein AUK47_04000 [Deltaproteobacteria bacterium CG2_30_63_29]
MIFKNTACIVVVLLVQLTGAVAQAECTLGLSVNNLNPSYDLFADEPYGAVVNFEVTHVNGDACSYFVTFSKGQASTYDRRMASGVNGLSYQLYRTASKVDVLKDEADATANEVLSGTITAEQTTPDPMTYFLVIPEHQLEAAGTYTDTFTMTIYEGTLGGTHSVDSSTPVDLTAVLLSQIELSLLDTASAFDPNDAAQTLNFGVLSEGEALGFDARIRSNAGWSMTMLSDHQGKLQLVGKAATTNTTVAYSLALDGVAKDLSGVSAVEVGTGAGPTALGGSLRPVAVTIGSVTGKAAGQYQDNVTITVSTTE